MKNIEAIDLFCGIGGLSYGLQQAGIEILAGLDVDSSCKYAYETNIKANFIDADVSKYDFNALKSLYSKNSVRVLVGCAPCQPFSSHSYKIKNKEIKDERWNLINHFVTAVKILKPAVISMENVRGLAKTEIFRSFVKAIESLKYSVEYKIVFCPDYGIPQNRYRLVLIGSQNFTLKIPKRTHNPEEYQTVRDAIEDLPEIIAGGECKHDIVHKSKGLAEINLKRIRQSKPNGTWKDWDKALLPDCYKRKSGQSYTSVYGRMDWDKPAPTITTQFFNYGSGRFGHPTQDRGLSLREGAILQTFPIDYDFGKTISLTTLGKHIGNAVPPRLGEVIGQQFLNFERNKYDQ